MRFEEFKGWLSLASPPKFSTTLIPFVLGSVLAWSEGHSPDFLSFFISLLAVILLTAFCFVLNASSVYEDLRNSRILPAHDSTHHRHHRTHLSGFHTTATTGRFEEFLSGRISVEKAIFGAYLCAALAIPLGFILQFILNTGELTLPIGLIGIFIAYSYSRGLKLSYIGLGELALAIGVGFITILSGFYIQAHSISITPLIAALPFMIDVFKMKIAREIPDYDYDRAINRINLVVRFSKNFAYCIYAPLTLMTWLSFIPMFVTGLISVPIAIFLLAIPAYFSFKSAFISLRLCRHAGTGERNEKEKRNEKKAVIEMCKNGFIGMTLIPAALITALLPELLLI